jgi:light-regulated signal transduction histidine kinase (bacteriophytochrome)
MLKRLEFDSDTEAAKYAAFIRTAVARMEQLIKDLLVYSRVVHPEQDAPRQADLNRSLADAISVLRMRIEEANASVTHAELPVVWGEEGQLSLVFQNLISNSLKYRREGVPPRIDISVEQSDCQCVVRVRDNGLGFHPRHAERIFGLFKRLHKDAYPGTGLGLAICKRVLERYGGRIWAESDGEGLGSTFCVALRTGLR